MRKIPLRILLLFLFKHQLAPSAVSYQCDISLTSIQSDLSTIFLVELGRGHVMTKFYEEDGTEITLNTGKTYIALVRDSRWSELVLK